MRLCYHKGGKLAPEKTENDCCILREGESLRMENLPLQESKIPNNSVKIVVALIVDRIALFYLESFASVLLLSEQPVG